jgi:hypothetical protein
VIYRTSSRLRQVSVAALLLSSGVILGTFAPRAPGAVRPNMHPAPAAPAGEVRTPARPAPVAPPDTAAPYGESPASVIESISADEPPAFGGAYAVLRGATTNGAILAESPDSGSPSIAPEFPGIPPRAADLPAADSATPPDEPEPRSAPERFRPAAAQGIPRGVAADYPLLAVYEGAGRLLFYDLGAHPGVVPASIEGAWAVLGDCGRAVQADFSAATTHAGELRAVGRGTSGSPGMAVVVAARQGCEAATARFTNARAVNPSERADFGSLAPDGFGAMDLVQVARNRGVLLLVFRSAGGSAAVIATTGLGSARAVWSTRVPPSGGDLGGIGVFRRGGALHAWLVVEKAGRPTALLAVTAPDGTTWSSSGPVTLVNR